MKLFLVMIILSLLSLSVKGATWYSENWGGSVTVEYSPYDIDEDNDIDMDDITLVVNALGTEGMPPEDVNGDQVVNYLDISGVCFYYED